MIGMTAKDRGVALKARNQHVLQDAENIAGGLVVARP
jgi:hypothetical protein